MEDKKAYLKWAHITQSVFFLNESIGNGQDCPSNSKGKTPKRQQSNLKRVEHNACHDQAEQESFLNRTSNELKDKLRAGKHLPSLHNCSSTMGREGGWKNYSTISQSGKENKSSLETSMLVLYLDKLRQQGNNKPPTTKQTRSQAGSLSRQLTNSKVISRRTNRRNATSKFFDTFEEMMQREDLRKVLLEVLECYELMVSFDFSNDQMVKTIKDSIQGRRILTGFLLRRVKGTSTSFSDKVHFVDKLDQLVEGLRNIYISYSHQPIAKEIRQYKTALQEKVIKRIKQRISQLEKAMIDPQVTLLQERNFCGALDTLHSISLEKIETRYGPCRLSRAQREVFARLSEYFGRSHLS